MRLDQGLGRKHPEPTVGQRVESQLDPAALGQELKVPGSGVRGPRPCGQKHRSARGVRPVLNLIGESIDHPRRQFSGRTIGDPFAIDRHRAPLFGPGLDHPQRGRALGEQVVLEQLGKAPSLDRFDRPIKQVGSSGQRDGSRQIHLTPGGPGELHAQGVDQLGTERPRRGRLDRRVAIGDIRQMSGLELGGGDDERQWGSRIHHRPDTALKAFQPAASNALRGGRQAVEDQAEGHPLCLKLIRRNDAPIGPEDLSQGKVLGQGASFGDLLIEGHRIGWIQPQRIPRPGDRHRAGGQPGDVGIADEGHDRVETGQGGGDGAARVGDHHVQVGRLGDDADRLRVAVVQLLEIGQLELGISRLHLKSDRDLDLGRRSPGIPDGELERIISHLFRSSADGHALRIERQAPRQPGQAEDHPLAVVLIHHRGSAEHPDEPLPIHAGEVFDVFLQLGRVVHIGDGHGQLPFNREASPIDHGDSQAIVTLSLEIQTSPGHDQIASHLEEAIVADPIDQTILKRFTPIRIGAQQSPHDVPRPRVLRNTHPGPGHQRRGFVRVDDRHHHRLIDAVACGVSGADHDGIGVVAIGV